MVNKFTKKNRTILVLVVQHLHYCNDAMYSSFASTLYTKCATTIDVAVMRRQLEYWL